MASNQDNNFDFVIDYGDESSEAAPPPAVPFGGPDDSGPAPQQGGPPQGYGAPPPAWGAPPPGATPHVGAPPPAPAGAPPDDPFGLDVELGDPLGGGGAGGGQGDIEDMFPIPDTGALHLTAELGPPPQLPSFVGNPDHGLGAPPAPPPSPSTAPTVPMAYPDAAPAPGELTGPPVVAGPSAPPIARGTPHRAQPAPFVPSPPPPARPTPGPGAPARAAAGTFHATFEAAAREALALHGDLLGRLLVPDEADAGAEERRVELIRATGLCHLDGAVLSELLRRA